MNAAELRAALPITGLAAEAVARVAGLDELAKTYEGLRGADDIAGRLLHSLSVKYVAAEADWDHVPRTGPTVVVANHPFGILEGAVLAVALRRLRPDVRILTNRMVGRIPELAGLAISIDPMTGHDPTSNQRGMREAMSHLAGGGLLVVFPAGAVASFQWREFAVKDAAWSPMVARLIRLSRASAVPVFIHGANGPAFQMAGLAHPLLRTALLGRELLNKRNAVVELNVGRPVDAAKLASFATDAECIAYLRWRTDLLSARRPVKQNTAHPVAPVFRKLRSDKIVAGVPVETLAREVAALPAGSLLDQSGDLAVYLAGAGQIPNVLEEIGRLREITFRAAGEGTGRATDRDAYDQHYEHLFLWNRAKWEIAGAYRLCRTDGSAARLYTSSLFGYGDEFLRTMGPAVELGRSFIREEYQRGFAPLLLLWKGIGAYVARHPKHKVLFGAVSISSRYQTVSRELIISFLEKWASLSEWKPLLRPKSAPAPAKGPVWCSDVDELSAAVSDVESGTAIPVLLRQYLKLGGKLVGFNVDGQFSQALDGLIVVDLLRTEPKLLARYLGKAGCETLLRHHQQTQVQ